MNINAIKLLLHLKNGSLSNKEKIVVNYYFKNIALLKILYKEGFIQSFKIKSDINSKLFFTIILRSYQNKAIFKNLKLISTPSLSRYFTFKDLIKLNDKRFTFFLSTDKGVLTILECKKQKLGGKLLFLC